MKSTNWRQTAIIVVALGLLACSSTNPGASSQVAPVDMTLRKGMTMPEVEAVYGNPYSAEEKTMGQKAAAPWDGIVWKYRLGKDPMYEYTVRYLTNTLVFTKTTNPPTLVYWEIEETPKPPKQKKSGTATKTLSN
jgi:hypothetical protein